MLGFLYSRKLSLTAVASHISLTHPSFRTAKQGYNCVECTGLKTPGDASVLCMWSRHGKDEKRNIDHLFISRVALVFLYLKFFYLTWVGSSFSVRSVNETGRFVQRFWTIDRLGHCTLMDLWDGDLAQHNEVPAGTTDHDVCGGSGPDAHQLQRPVHLQVAVHPTTPSHIRIEQNKHAT
jgi:hypothetical protein